MLKAGITPTRPTPVADSDKLVKEDMAYVAPTSRALWLLTRAQRAFDAQMDALLEEVGITWTQYTVLEAVVTCKRATGISAASVARRLRVTAQSAQPLVSVLERRGLLVRTYKKGDGRTMYIQLTPLGFDAYNQAKRRITAFEKQLADRFGEGQYEALLSYLDMLICDLVSDASE